MEVRPRRASAAAHRLRGLDIELSLQRRGGSGANASRRAPTARESGEAAAAKVTRTLRPVSVFGRGSEGGMSENDRITSTHAARTLMRICMSEEWALKSRAYSADGSRDRALITAQRRQTHAAKA